MISWMKRNQKYVAFNTAKAKYIIASMASCEVVSLMKLFGVIEQNDPLISSEGKDMIVEAKTKITHLVSTLTLVIH